MCGFWGEIFKTISRFILGNRHKAIHEALKVRGNDNSNEYTGKNFFFAHSRLHLSGGENDGLQPVITECKKFIFVYNGEVYNHKSLSNFKLSNKSDTDSISYSLSMNGVEDTIRSLMECLH